MSTRKSAQPEAEPGLPPPENRRFYPALDGLRAIAVLLVFFHHYAIARYPWLSWGWVGVDIFFVLSGFLITGILYDTRHSIRRVRGFYARRTLRIFPLYYALWLAVLLSTPLFHLQWSPRWLLWPLYLGNYTHLVANSAVPQLRVDWLFTGSAHAESLVGKFLSFGHLWSLSVEEQFYLFWPVVVFSTADRGRRLLHICFSVILLSPVLRALTFYLASPNLLSRELLYRSTPFRCDAFLIGAAMAVLLRGRRAPQLLRFAPWLLLVTATALLLTRAIAVYGFAAPTGGSPLIGWICTIGFTWIDLIAAAVILIALQPQSLLFRALQWPPLPQLGRISYGFYVFHDIAHPVLERLGIRLMRHFTHVFYPLAGVFFPLLCTTILAALSYHFFERPFLRLKSRFEAGPRRSPQTQEPPV